MMDFYEILGVERGATFEEIRNAYRELVKKAHPDMGGSPEKFRLIQMAYETLGDPGKRLEYDNSNEANPVISFLTRLFLHVLDSLDPEKTDLFQSMKKAIVVKIQEMASQKQIIKRKIKKLSKAERRIRKDSNGLFRAVLKTQTQICMDSIVEIEKAEKIILEAHKKLLDCEYEIDPVILQLEKKTPATQ